MRVMFVADVCANIMRCSHDMLMFNLRAQSVDVNFCVSHSRHIAREWRQVTRVSCAPL